MSQPHIEYMTVTINDPIQYHYIHTCTYDLSQCLYCLFPNRCRHFVYKFHTQGIRMKVPISLI